MVSNVPIAFPVVQVISSIIPNGRWRLPTPIHVARTAGRPERENPRTAAASS
jgi:hypothetical protein